VSKSSSNSPAADADDQSTFLASLRSTLPSSTDEEVVWSRLYAATQSLAIAEIGPWLDGIALVVCPDNRRADMMTEELSFFAARGTADGAPELPILSLSDRESLIYDRIAPRQEITSERLLALHQLRSLKTGIVVVSAETLALRLPPPEYIDARSFFLTVNQQLDINALREKLDRSAYASVRQVMAPGEFAVRGGIVDVFPAGSDHPFRIDLFDDIVETIRIFDPETQRTINQVDRIELLPATEYPFDEEAIKLFRQNFRSRFEGDPQQQLVYREVSRGHAPAGIENFLPLFFESTASLFDYLAPQTTLLLIDEVEDTIARHQLEVEERHVHACIDVEYRVLEPVELVLPVDTILAQLNKFQRIRIRGSADDDIEPVVATRAPWQINVDMRAEQPYDVLLERLIDGDSRKLLIAESLGRRDALESVIRDAGLNPDVVDGWRDFISGSADITLLHGRIERGLTLLDPAIEVLAEAQFYGPRNTQKRRRSEKSRDPESIIRDLAELEDGAPVVHDIHGIGRYRGLSTIASLGTDTEFLTIEYQNEDKLYVPVLSLQLVSRYIGGHPDSAPLNRLGTDSWAKARKKARAKAYDVAAELLELEALRSARAGIAFEIPADHYAAFAANFPFEETPDQEQAILDVLDDMASAEPMDRLVCGDVGFGKTEVAIRAAYIAVLAGKQVAILVPTTLLAQQHYDNFCERFAGQAIDVELLSRFVSKKKATAILDRLSEGKPDIIIGTHRLLQKDINFGNLGLLILDEEHRFGVRQKEQLKKLRSEVDILTLTATPIPRTLNFAMAGLRKISVIATPPADRLAIKTFVHETSDSLVREAITREMRRGGQVYVVHNRVQTIEQRGEELRALVPDAEIGIGHGQMTERDLENIMADFYHRRFNVLLCTTIIESGIDIPSANTIIIDRADRFGLAQLHQLRGRVGRSNQQAYAYLLTPGRKSMTGDAIKRLEAIASLEQLGAGFALASQDLEIRGAGELLGEAQSGSIDQVGFTLYTDFLNRAIKTIRDANTDDSAQDLDADALLAKDLQTEQTQTEINLHLPALFHSDFIPDVHVRLVMYKRIASADSEEALRELQVETIDRFGLIPDAGKALFRLSGLKLKARQLGIQRIDVGENGGRVDFVDEPPIGPESIIALLQSMPSRYSMKSPTALRIDGEFEDETLRIDAVAQCLDELIEMTPI